MSTMMLSMSVKRVPLDFDWPLSKIWAGYAGPDTRSCPSPDCRHGVISARDALESLADTILLLASVADRDRVYPGLEEIIGEVPGPEIKQLTSGLAGRAPSGLLGHDSCDRLSATRKIIAAAGLADDWGLCPICKGSDVHPDDAKLTEEWESHDPPSGPGYQLWETISEGSPVSPVFSTPSELARWLEQNPPENYRHFGYSDWLGVITDRVLGTDLSDGKTIISHQG